MGSHVWAKFPKIDPPAARLLCETAIFFGKFLDFYSGRNSVKFLRKNTYVLPNAKLRRAPLAETGLSHNEPFWPIPRSMGYFNNRRRATGM